MFMSGFGRRNVFKSIVLYLCVSALFILPISTLLTSLPAFAAGYFDNLNTQGKYKFYVYARVMNACFTTAYRNGKFLHGIDEIKKGDIWKNEPSVYVGTFPGFTGYNSSGGYFECNSELINAAISQFNIQPKGRSSAAEVLLCEIGYRRSGGKDSLDSCVNGTGPLFNPVELGYTRTEPLYSENKIFDILTRLSGYEKGSENSNPSIKYLVSRSMIRGCIKDDNPQPRRHDSKDWEIQDVDSNGNLTNSYYLPGDGQGYNVGGSNNREWPQNHYDANISEWQCMNIYRRLVESAPKYQEALRQSATDTACVGLADENLKAICEDGVNHNGNSAYCEKQYKEKPNEINACKQGQSAEIKTPSEGDGGGEEEEKNSCGIDGMGWLICPLMTFMGGIADASYSVISQFLNIRPAIFDEGSDAVGAEQAWNFFRDIANVIFVLLFLWVIFSQVSSVGISNYGIKKILPKLIVGAVLVNLSFYICQLAVDLSNILGFTLKEALEGAVSGVGGSSSNSAIASGLGAAVAGILVLTGTVLFAALAVSIPTLLSLMLVLLVVLVILIVRQAAIVLLISIAPLAFAAWLLPNTESLFKKWVSMFRGLLMVFPIISLLYGAGKLAGAILMTTATSDPNDTAITMQFAGLAASILPLGATPFVLQSSLNSLGNIGAKIGRMGANAHSRFAGNIKGAAKGRVDNSVIGDTKRKYSDFMNRKRASRRTGKFATWRDNSPLGQFMGWDKGGARARATVAKAFESDVENASTMLQGMTSDKIAKIANGTTVESKAMRAAAIDHTMANGSFKERMDVLSSLKGTDNSIKQRAIKAAYAKKDNNILGNGFGDAILNDEVGSMQDLSNMAVNNAASGNLQAEHLVQNGAATKWLSDAITNSGNQQAKDAFRKAGEVAISNPNTAKNINQAISEALNAHGVVAHNTPQNTSSYNSQQNSQGSGSQQSPQNNQQNNSSSGEKIIIATSQEDVRKALEDSRRRGN